MRPGIDAASGIQATARAKHSSAAKRRHLQPDLIGVRGAFGEEMPQLQRSQHHVEDVFAAGHQRRYFWPQWRNDGRVDVAAFVDGEDVRAQAAGQKLSVRRRHRFRKVQPVAEGGIGGGKAVAMHR